MARSAARRNAASNARPRPRRPKSLEIGCSRHRRRRLVRRVPSSLDKDSGKLRNADKRMCTRRESEESQELRNGGMGRVGEDVWLVAGDTVWEECSKRTVDLRT